MSDTTEAKLRDLLERAIAAKDQSEVERLFTEFRLILNEHVSTAKVALKMQLLLMPD